MNVAVGTIEQSRTVKRGHIALLLLASLGSVASSASAQDAVDNERVAYIFQPGDTLLELAGKYLRKQSDYLVVQRLNRIRDPRAIPIGKTVYIPFNLLKFRASEANVSAFRGDVSILSMGRSLPPVRGATIGEGSRITTAAGGFVTFELEDGSRISVPSNSAVRITRLRQILLTNTVDYELMVEKGRIRSKASPLTKKYDRHRVRTPVAVSAVRGTDFRTRFDDQATIGYSETVEGSVDVAAGANIASAKKVAVPAGTGAAASKSGNLVKANLLAAPELIDPAKIQSDENLHFAIKPQAEAVGSRLIVASDAGFVDIAAEQQKDSLTLEIPSLPDGRYFAKASLLSRDGFEGLPTTYSFIRQITTLSSQVDKVGLGFQFRWSGQGSGKRYYRFQLMRDSKDAVPTIDEAGLTVGALTVSSLPAGEYYWRIGLTQFGDAASETGAIEKWLDFEKLTVVN